MPFLLFSVRQLQAAEAKIKGLLPGMSNKTNKYFMDDEVVEGGEEGLEEQEDMDENEDDEEEEEGGEIAEKDAPVEEEPGI